MFLCFDSKELLQYEFGFRNKCGQYFDIGYFVIMFLVVYENLLKQVMYERGYMIKRMIFCGVVFYMLNWFIFGN